MTIKTVSSHLQLFEATCTYFELVAIIWSLLHLFQATCNYLKLPAPFSSHLKFSETSCTNLKCLGLTMKFYGHLFRSTLPFPFREHKSRNYMWLFVCFLPDTQYLWEYTRCQPIIFCRTRWDYNFSYQHKCKTNSNSESSQINMCFWPQMDWYLTLVRTKLKCFLLFKTARDAHCIPDRWKSECLCLLISWSR